MTDMFGGLTPASMLQVGDYVPGLGVVVSTDPLATRESGNICPDASYCGVVRVGDGLPPDLAGINISNVTIELPAVLPTDSAARKAIPVCTGCLDYAPDAIAELIDLLESGDEIQDPTSNDVLVLLPARGDRTASPQLVQVCLDLLQDELVGPPTQCRSRLLAKRWGAAFAEVARISKAGNDKHNPGEPLHHARGKSMDHADCIARHTLEEGGFDGEFRHSACRAWRALMLRQEQLEAQGLPLARAAWLPDGTKGSDRFEPSGAVDLGTETTPI